MIILSINNFDKDKLQKELDYQVKATQDFQTVTVATINEKIVTHAESKRAEAEQATQPKPESWNKKRRNGKPVELTDKGWMQLPTQ